MRRNGLVVLPVAVLPVAAAAVALAVAVSLSGCSKKSESPASAASSPASSGGSAPSVAPPVGPLPSGAGAGIASTLSERLQREAQSRPPIHPNADEVLAAFEKAGGAVATKKQGLGATYQASFCEGGTTSDGAVTLSVCEYADDAAATAGLAALQAIYPAKQARHVLHKDTVLTTLRLQDAPAAQALETKLVAAYTAL